jgi:predicted nucleotidyltransferase component of viral defense system
MVELREARKIASSSGLGLQYVLKEARVFDIWERLSSLIMSEKVRSKVVIVSKGGTALNKIFLPGVQRFSEDLDFDAFFKGSTTRSHKIEFLQSELIAALVNDYDVQKPRMMREVVRFTCSFVNEMGKKDSVFVEFNLRAHKVGRIVLEEAHSQLWGTDVRVPVYSFEAIVAKKLKTFYERETGKDLYDIYRSLEGRTDAEMRRIVTTLRRVLKAEGIKYSDFVTGVSKALQNEELISSVHASSNPYIPRALRVGWRQIADKIRKTLVPYL